MRTPHELVMEWHRIYGVPIGEEPDFITVDRTKLRMDLIKEEYHELVTAVREGNFNETIDALGDLVYVIYGMAIEMGVNLDLVMEEIQRSNLSKLGEDGKPIYRADGKVLKGPNYSPPDLDRIFDNQPRLR